MMFEHDSTTPRVVNMKKTLPTRPVYLNSTKALEPYKRFSEIYKEMKFARAFPKQTNSFLDLPAEIRVKIYRYAFLFEEPLELWALSLRREERSVRLRNKERLLEHIEKRYLNLSFLRTCRLIHNEGSEVFYGENDFRFMAVNGHVVANLFARKIGEQHFQWMKQLTVAIPLALSACYHPGQRKGKNWQDWNDLVSQLPANNWEGKCYFDYVHSWQHLAGSLKCMVRLRKLTLVLPWDYHTFRHSQKNETLFDEIRALIAAKPDMAIVIVRLQEFEQHPNAGEQLEIWDAYGCPDSHALVMQKFKDMAKGCRIKAAYEDDCGSWKIVDDIPEAVLLP